MGKLYEAYFLAGMVAGYQSGTLHSKLCFVAAVRSGESSNTQSSVSCHVHVRFRLSTCVLSHLMSCTCSAEVLRNMNAFYMGAHEINPNVTMDVIWYVHVT